MKIIAKMLLIKRKTVKFFEQKLLASFPWNLQNLIYGAKLTGCYPMIGAGGQFYQQNIPSRSISQTIYDLKIGARSTQWRNGTWNGV